MLSPPKLTSAAIEATVTKRRTKRELQEPEPKVIDSLFFSKPIVGAGPRLLPVLKKWGGIAELKACRIIYQPLLRKSSIFVHFPLSADDVRNRYRNTWFFSLAA